MCHLKEEKGTMKNKLQATSGPEECGLCFEINTEFSGILIKQIDNTKDAMYCQEECYKLESCKFWTFQIDSHICQLKKAMVAKSSQQDMISGPKLCSK